MPLRHLAAYGVLIGAGQFGLLYIAMTGYISPGLASLVSQMQVVFTIALSMILSGERIRSFQIGTVALAGAGIVVIALHAHGSATPLGLGLVICAALSWAGGNTMFGFALWAWLLSRHPAATISPISRLETGCHCPGSRRISREFFLA